MSYKKETIQSLEKEMFKLSELYFAALSKKDAEMMLREESEEFTEYEYFVIKMRNAFNKLSEKEKEMINNEYFYQDYPYWWKKKYSKSSFEKIKRRSVVSFLEAFENEE